MSYPISILPKRGAYIIKQFRSQVKFYPDALTIHRNTFDQYIR